MAESLYGTKKASKVKEISSSSSLAFSSNLASLISSSAGKATSAGRPRPSKSKADLFTAHNKNVKKRAAADLDDGEQNHKTRDDIGSVDSAMLHRSKRKMEEKARLYNAMKRGEYISSDDRGLVDFDRKWAEKEAKGGKEDEDSLGSDEDESDNAEELIEYEDEFGRTRKGTKVEAAREERRRKIRANAVEEEERLSARPKAPTNIIYGDAVQTNAFNPDTVIADRMAELAQKRDKSATPPPDTHYDANAEVRTKGTGFYAFSHDKEGRQQEMDALEKERVETERVRMERENKKEQRKKNIEERRRLIAEQRSKAQADKFLRGLETEENEQDRDTG